MGIVEQREPVRLQVDDRLHSPAEACRRLQWQAVNQVDAQRMVLQRAGRLDDGAGLLQGLHAIYGALDIRVQILHADADAVEAQFAEQSDGWPIRFPGVDFDAEVAVIIVLQVEVLAQMTHQPPQLIMAEKRRCAAAKVQLLDDLVLAQVAGDQLDFLLETFQIGLCTCPVVGHHLVAAAVVTGVGTEWQVNVQRQRT